MNFSKLTKPPRYYARTKAVTKILGQLNYDSILELGYGDGYIISHFSKPQTKFKFGFEISDSARSSARKYFSKFRVVDLESMPKDSSLDLIISFETIGYFNEVSDFFQLSSEALKPGGLLMFSATIQKDDNLEESVTGMKVFTKDYLFHELERSDYEVISVTSYGGFAIQLIHKLRGIFRKAINLESQEVVNSWQDPFSSKIVQLAYIIINVSLTPLEYISRFFSHSFSGVIFVARKV